MVLAAASFLFSPSQRPRPHFLFFYAFPFLFLLPQITASYSPFLLFLHVFGGFFTVTVIVMTRKPFSRHSLESCTLKLGDWKPFFLSSDPPKPTTIQNGNTNKPSAQKSDSGDAFYALPTKKHCQFHRPTDLLPSFPNHMNFLGTPSLTLMEDNEQMKKMIRRSRRPSKRRRRSLQSASGSCSRDRSDLLVSVASASDFPVFVGTDSSGELFFNCHPNWISGDAKVCSRKELFGGRENFRPSSCSVLVGPIDSPGNESGYASEAGYKGDVEYEYGDELDGEEEDSQALFWGESDATEMDVEDCVEQVADDALSEQKNHYRFNLKKHDCRMAVQ